MIDIAGTDVPLGSFDELEVSTCPVSQTRCPNIPASVLVAILRLLTAD